MPFLSATNSEGIAGIARRLRARELSVRELIEATLRRIDAVNPTLNAFITVTHEAALARAGKLDAMLARGEDLGPLHGIPVAHKDCFYTAGVRTTGGSPIFRDFVPDHDAEVVRRLHNAGMVMVGKTGLHELTYGITNINRHYDTVQNPHTAKLDTRELPEGSLIGLRDPEASASLEPRVSGGSSGGSGAAISAGLVPCATGTDTGGSIRIPASFCGCVGLKPTFDRIPRAGCMALGPSQDHAGPMAATVADSALLYDAMRLRSAAPRTTDVKGLRIGVPENYFWDNLQPDVRFACRGAVQVIGALGAIPREIRVADGAELNELGRLTLLYEAARTLGAHSSRKEDFGEDVWALLEKGRAISDAEYQQSQERRRRLSQEWLLLWSDLDLLMMPTTPMTAYPIEGQTDQRPETTRLTRPFNLLGWPAISLPAGISSEGLPIGVQLVAAPGKEEVLFRAAAAIESGVQIPLKKRTDL